MYDRADKVIDLDQDTIIAIARFARVAFEMARTLQTSFQYYRRSQLQALSLNAKVRALGKLIKDNLPMTLQGVGAVVPILAARDHQHHPDPLLYFYDALGAQFQAVDSPFPAPVACRAQRPSVDQSLERSAHVAARRKGRGSARTAIASTSRPSPTALPAALIGAPRFSAGQGADQRWPALPRRRHHSRMLYRPRSSPKINPQTKGSP